MVTIKEGRGKGVLFSERPQGKGAMVTAKNLKVLFSLFYY